MDNKVSTHSGEKSKPAAAALGLLFGLIWTLSAWAQGVSFTSSLVWAGSNDAGDFVFQTQELNAAALDGQGYPSLPPDASKPAEFISRIIPAAGVIQEASLDCYFIGQVRTYLSSDAGATYIEAPSGRPIELSGLRGKELRVKAVIYPGSTLKKISLDYRDETNAIVGFGQPQLSGFKQRKKITIAPAQENEFFNSVVAVRLGLKTENKDCDATLEGKAKPDFSDVRFVYSDAKTLIPYYFAKPPASSETGLFYLRPQFIGSKGLSFCVYFSNPSAVSLSEPAAVCEAWQDYSSAPLTLRSSEHVISESMSLDSLIIEYRATIEKDADVQLVVSDKANELITNTSAYAGSEHCLAVNGVVKTNSPKIVAFGESKDYRLTFKAGQVSFERFDALSGKSEALVTQEIAINNGRIKIKNSGSTISQIYSISARRDSGRQFSVEAASAEPVTAAGRFLAVKLDDAGNLIVDKNAAIAVYETPVLTLLQEPRMLVPDFAFESAGGRVSMDVSLDAGLTYLRDVVNLRPVQTGRAINKGKQVKLRFSFIPAKTAQLKLFSAGLKSLAGQAKLLFPADKSSLTGGNKYRIIWSAPDYDPDYPLKLEYSLDKGRTFRLIADAVYNSGKYLWQVPIEAGSAGLIRISQGFAPYEVLAQSQGPFSIVAPGKKR